jgi:Kinesin motor domain
LHGIFLDLSLSPFLNLSPTLSLPLSLTDLLSTHTITAGDLNHRDVPYRDSKLTKLLISSLGGKTRTLLVACVTEASGSQVETLRTLKFR